MIAEQYLQVNTEEKEIRALLRQAGSFEKGFELMVRTYQQRLYAHIRRILPDHHQSDDVLQNTFLKAWKGYHNFRGDSQLYTWLYRIATNEALSLLRSDKRRQIHTGTEADTEQLAGSLNAGDAGGDEISRRLHDAIRKLPPKQQAIFNMKYFDEMTYEDMAAVTGTSVGALKASYHHAVKKIERAVLREYPGPAKPG